MFQLIWQQPFQEKKISHWWYKPTFVLQYVHIHFCAVLHASKHICIPYTTIEGRTWQPTRGHPSPTVHLGLVQPADSRHLPNHWSPDSHKAWSPQLQCQMRVGEYGQPSSLFQKKNNNQKKGLGLEVCIQNKNTWHWSETRCGQHG